MPPDRLKATRKPAPSRPTRGAKQQVRPRRDPAPAAALAGEKDGRERILAVAIRSFSQIGYEGTTTAGVARDADVTQPLVHHHFGSKEGMWRAAMDVLFSNAARLVDVPRDAPLLDQLVAISDGFVRFAAEHPEVTRVMTREGAAPGPRLAYLVDRYLREPFDRVVETLRAGQRAGLIAADIQPDLMLFLFLGAGSHLFDVTALARESRGIDTTDARTREEFAALVRTMIERILFVPGGKSRRR